VPNYLEELPLTIYGEPFTYRQDEIDIYFISFDLKRKGGENIIFFCGYIRGKDLWECSASHP
jgi:hypothetical protein